MQELPNLVAWKNTSKWVAKGHWQSQQQTSTDDLQENHWEFVFPGQLGDWKYTWAPSTEEQREVEASGSLNKQ